MQNFYYLLFRVLYICNLLVISLLLFFFFFKKNLLLQIYVETNPRGAELLPPGIIVSESDFYLRRLWGDPEMVYTFYYLVLPITCYSLLSI